MAHIGVLLPENTKGTTPNDDFRQIEEIYKYWFGVNQNTWSKKYPLKTRFWFGKKLHGVEIQNRFEYLLKDIIRPDDPNTLSETAERWLHSPRGCIALVLLLDQFYKKMYHDTSKMYSNTQLIQQIVTQIVENDAKGDQPSLFSLPEKLFLYAPLYTSEDPVLIERGVNLLQSVADAAIHYDRRLKFQKVLEEAKLHQAIVAKYGRDPTRNQIMGRESTEEEKTFLAANLNPKKETQLKFAENAPETSGSSKAKKSNVAKIPTSLRPQSTHRPLRILVLHGLRQNARLFRRGTKRMVNKMNGVATFHFANAPMSYNPSKEVAPRISLASAFNSLPEANYQRQWWQSSPDNSVYHHIEASLHYLEGLWKSEGPFDGILGFSQGAALTGILSAMQPSSNIAFRFAILISGFPARADAYKELMKPNSIMGIPSLHVMEIKDEMVEIERSRNLANCYEVRRIVEHPGGHFTPGKWPVEEIRDFLVEMQTGKGREEEDQDFHRNLHELSHEKELETLDEKLQVSLHYHKMRVTKVNTNSAEDLFMLPLGLSKETRVLLLSLPAFSPLLYSQNSEKSFSPSMEDVEELVSIAVASANKEKVLEDLMVVAWSTRIDHGTSELVSNEIYFKFLIQILLASPKLFVTHLDALYKYGGWRDLVNLGMFAEKSKEDSLSKGVDQTEAYDQLYNALVSTFAKQLIKDHELVKSQWNPDEEQVDSQESELWPSFCATEAPRMHSNKKSYASRMAKSVARVIFPFNLPADANEKQFNTAKGKCYHAYKRMLASICHVLQRVSPNFIEREVSSRHRKDRAALLTDAQRNEILSGPPSAYVLSPEPEPVVPCSLEELDPLLRFMHANTPLPSDSPIQFIRGTAMPDGRLDLCKQVVGPKGIHPLLDAMKNSSGIQRLLLGNNIVGNGGAQAIADYIEFNKDSKIDTWYIAGNNFDADGIQLIAAALANDSKVKSLWLKRNPILAAGTRHIADMLTKNCYLQTLDLLNCGLLDEGVTLLFEGLKHNSTLKNLYIDTNGLTPVSATTIRNHLERGSHLETLYLSCNRMGDKGVEEIAKGLTVDKKLQRLGLGSNCVGPEGAKALVDAITPHPTLLQLNLGFTRATILLGSLNNVLGDLGANEIARLITNNNVIRSIDLTHNSISQNGVNTLRLALRTNRNLTSLKLVQFGQVHNELDRDDITNMLARNRMEWGKQVCGEEQEKEWLKVGDKLAEEVNVPLHVAEILSVYRTK